MNAEQHNTHAPRLRPFDHPLTIGILGLVILLIAGGLLLAYYQGFIGIVCTIVGGLIFAGGLVKHSPDKPRQAGLVTLFGAPIRIGGKNVVVGGTTILAPYIGLSTIKVNIETKSLEFPMTVLSAEKNKKPVPVSGKMKVICHPNLNDFEDWIQIGNSMDEAKILLDDFVFPRVQQIINEKEMSPTDISQNGTVISAELELHMDDLFTNRQFGLELDHCRAEFNIPQDIQDAMKDVEKEKYQRDSEIADQETFRIIARNTQREAARELIVDGHAMTPDVIDAHIGELVRSKKLNNLDWYIGEARLSRITKDGMVARIEGGSGNLIVNDPGFHFGGKNKKGN